MTLLLDTHALPWWLADDLALTPEARYDAGSILPPGLHMNALVDVTVRDGGIHELRLARAPVNALDPAVCVALREAIDTAIRKQAEQRFASAEADTLAYTCGRLRLTLRGEPALPLTGNTLDEDTRAEVLDEIIPVASKLMACEALEGVRVRPAPPPILRTDASSMSALADRVEMWDVKGCGRSLDVEVSLRFPEGEPPTFALGFPRTARPLRE